MTKRLALLLPALAATHFTFAREGYDHPPLPSSIGDPMVTMLVIIMAILLLIIILLAHVLTGAASFYYKREKEIEAEKKKINVSSTVLTVAVLFFCMPLFAQDAPADAEAVVVQAKSFGPLSATAYYLVTGVIAIELLVIVALLWQLRTFLSRVKKQNATEHEKATKPAAWKTIWAKLNSLKPIEQEKALVMDHEYDGIRELDNRLPPWWLYGFYGTIIFAGIYLWRYHVSETAPLSQQEFAIAMEKAEEQKAAYLKKSANNVDENTVKMLTESSALDAGKTVFIQNCAACHGKDGEGTVGPNLTDDYWLHGGSIADVFKSVKYGWPEKGMRSWKEDLSPVQIAQVSSFIKSLHGSNPPNGKEKQGELYQESGAAPSDSTAAKADSSVVSAK
ncbi:cbb3-type cytochrome c oxidase N-terminal domain-containing protein [Pseudobacter ginsenosidimutans]|uniref:Cytochrome c oxidase cbb3-type subunit 3 n=1 Tax=Pseudobacter ginsenosidimutans TaxID=661488 RepID=A0A4Q7MRD5_9BACT|nr:cbb3-type cytochrome c oxidase N-terminal domain-containing protein [Pseudobacter ginsenosidimutans]RZS69329.1 cytochrome c oxidase cbb3-type subunit 3 [Pseudobacter ginsenosidimutans]